MSAEASDTAVHFIMEKLKTRKYQDHPLPLQSCGDIIQKRQKEFTIHLPQFT